MRFENYDIAGSTILIPFAENLSDVKELIASDYFRYSGHKESSWFKLWFHSLLNHSFSYTFWWRLVAYNGLNRIFQTICKLILKKKSDKYGVFILKGVKCGFGLYLGHGIGIVINETSIIGNNVNISQFVNIGANSGKAAIIGDNVYIGPMCCLVEDIIIGSNATIGAGAVVTKNVEKNVTVGGVPAKVISYSTPARFIKNKYE